MRTLCIVFTALVVAMGWLVPATHARLGRSLLTIPGCVTNGTELVSCTQPAGSTTLNLANYGITRVHPLAFQGLNLTRLDLSGNQIARMTNGTLHGTTRLVNVELSFNPFTHMETGFFTWLPHLQSIVIRRCSKWTSTGKYIFGHNPSLQRIDFSENSQLQQWAPPTSLGELPALTKIDVSTCPKLEYLPYALGKQTPVMATFTAKDTPAGQSPCPGTAFFMERPVPATAALQDATFVIKACWAVACWNGDAPAGVTGTCPPEPPKEDTTIPRVIGGTIGAAVLLVLIVGLAGWWYIRRRKRQRAAQGHANLRSDSSESGDGAEEQDFQRRTFQGFDPAAFRDDNDASATTPRSKSGRDGSVRMPEKVEQSEEQDDGPAAATPAALLGGEARNAQVVPMTPSDRRAGGQSSAQQEDALAGAVASAMAVPVADSSDEEEDMVKAIHAQNGTVEVSTDEDA